jgi:hypothetical protein
MFVNLKSIDLNADTSVFHLSLSVLDTPLFLLPQLNCFIGLSVSSVIRSFTAKDHKPTWSSYNMFIFPNFQTIRDMSTNFSKNPKY